MHSPGASDLPRTEEVPRLTLGHVLPFGLPCLPPERPLGRPACPLGALWAVLGLQI